MALNKLLQQFTHNARDKGAETAEAESARSVDTEVLSTQPTAGLATAAVAPANKPLDPIAKGILEEEIIEALRGCYDPEIPVNIYDMGLIYEIDIDRDAFVDVKMTLTSPGCPVAGTLPPDVQRRVAGVEGVSGAKVELVWEPTWNMEMMSEDARLELGFY